MLKVWKTEKVGGYGLKVALVYMDARKGKGWDTFLQRKKNSS